MYISLFMLREKKEKKCVGTQGSVQFLLLEWSGNKIIEHIRSGCSSSLPSAAVLYFQSATFHKCVLGWQCYTTRPQMLRTCNKRQTISVRLVTLHFSEKYIECFFILG
ncbi:hypothetical protein ATANTOWER_026246 [Ataeniobius toweri]|uniref:Uncharacterized protein n=1 Tax=Ataeniobius toweri TaxID=208326 RepID=A0ABU7BL73_9TELE|nr:hypothetical protein [Ataeniobius toweri]